MFYESNNSLHSDLFKIEWGCDFSFPMHLHTSFELITVNDGEMKVKVEKNEYLLKKGMAVLVFPNQLHSLQTDTHGEHFLCIFSPQLVKAYKNTYLNNVPKNNMFSPNPFHLDMLFSPNGDNGHLRIKGLLYSICAEFDSTAEYKERNSGEESLLMKMFKFVETDYSRECNLQMLAEQISYHKVYLSRYFKKCTGITFSDYVNRYRVNEGAYILRNSQKKILDVAMECGFDSLRSFNRNFKKIMGKTPNKYRSGEI
ncbi:MAG: AraC family transcriptional regulator [Clostridia bacterium]|nr:AraC family transcriptional regulator [Clostridia bacterium]